jgi:hypothetical protein
MKDQMTVQSGSHAEVELIDKKGKRESMAFDIVPDEAADFEKGLLGAGTPLAQALVGHAAGETLTYARGDIASVHILSVRPALQSDLTDAAAQRDETLRRARDQAELANMVSFALTFDSKWGDYNLDMLETDDNADSNAESGGTGQDTDKGEKS